LTPDHGRLEALAASGLKHPFDPQFDRAFADELFGRAARDLLPVGMIGLLLVGSLAATVSSADTRMLAAGALFTEGLYRPFWGKNRSAAHFLWVGRVASVGVVIAAIVLQTTFTDIIDALKFIIKTTAPIGISFWIGIVWRGWTPAAVWVSSITSYAVWAVAAYYPAAFATLGFGESVVHARDGLLRVNDSWTMFLYLTSGLVAGILVSFITPRTPVEKLDRFFLLLRTPVRKGEQVAGPCELPENPEPPVAKWVQHPDWEMPRPSAVGVGGFLLACLFVAIIAMIPYCLVQLF
jgi:Na+/proline symporter